MARLASGWHNGVCKASSKSLAAAVSHPDLAMLSSTKLLRLACSPFMALTPTLLWLELVLCSFPWTIQHIDICLSLSLELVRLLRLKLRAHVLLQMRRLS